jgi:hypothetical protein
MMGLAPGWARGLGPARPAALRLLGNGVLPPQAVTALPALLIAHVAAALA